MAKKPTATNSNFDNDFEQVQTVFPPIYYPGKEGSVLIFIPTGIKEGPNGTLIQAKLVKNDGGSFRTGGEDVELDNNVFALGCTPTLTGDDKLVQKHGKNDPGEFTKLGEYSVENDLPIKLVYKGKKKSKQNRGFAYHTFEFWPSKKALQNANEDF